MIVTPNFASWIHLEKYRGVKSTWKPYLSKSTDTVKITQLHVTSHQFQNNLSKSLRVSDFNST